MEGSSQLPSDRDLQQHMQDVSIKPSASGGTTLCRTTAPAEAPQGSEPISPTAGAAMGRYSSYKSPVELLSAPSSGKVSIAGRRLETGEIVESEVIHLQDFTANTTTGHMQGSRGDQAFTAASPTGPQTPAAAPSAFTTAAAESPDSRTIQETTRTPEQVYLTHATVAAAAAAAGGLVGGAHLDVRTAANVAEAAVDPAAVVDFDCTTPTAAAPARSGPQDTMQQLNILQDSPASAQEGSSGGSSAGQQGAGASVQDGMVAAEGEEEGWHAGHAVLPEDREEVATTLQRLRSAGQLQGPDTPTVTSHSTAQVAAPAVNTEDSFIGAAAASTAAGFGSQVGSSAGGSAAGAATAAGYPSAQGVSAGTAAPAKAGFPDPTPGTASEQQETSTAPTELHAGLQETAPGSSSSNLLAMHDAAAHAAAVAGALAHIGTPVTTAAALANTATHPAEAVEAAAAAAATAPGHDDTSSGIAAAATPRASSLHQQHTLAEFLLDEPVAAAIAASHNSHSSTGGTAGSFAESMTAPDLSVGTAATDEFLEVQLDVGRSTRVMSPDGSVATAAATVPQEAVAAIQATDPGDPPKSPRHPSLRQLSMPRQQPGTSSSQQTQQQASGGLPYGLTVADIVAATVASEERRFRVMSPRSSAGDNFFTASSGSAPSSPALAEAAVERSNSPLSASATRAIFDSVQLAVQQQQQTDQLALSVARSASLGRQAAASQQSGQVSHSAEVSTTAQMASAGSGDSTATSSRPSSADSAGAGPSTGATAVTPGAGVGSFSCPAAPEVAQKNAEVMQEMLLHEVVTAGQPADVAAAGTHAGAQTLSTDSAASQCGDSEVVLDTRMDGTDVGSMPSFSAGDRMAAAVAAEVADPVAAAAAGADVAATAAPAFASVLFGLGTTPVDVPAVPRTSPGSTESGPSSGGKDTPGASAADLSTAVELTTAGLASLRDSDSLQDSVSTATDASVSDPAALQKVINATSAAVIASAGMQAPAAAAAAAAAAATEMHAAAAELDPAAAAADAAMLVVEAARTVPGLLEPADVASAAAAAGAAVAAAATPGMDPATAAIACAAAAAAPMADPDDVAVAAARAVASMQQGSALQDSMAVEGHAAATGGSSAPIAGNASAFASIPAASQSPGSPSATTSAGVAAPVSGAGVQHSDGSGLAHDNSSDLERACSSGMDGDLRTLLPILAPSGQIGDAIPVSSSALETAIGGAATASHLAAPAALQDRAAPALSPVPESGELLPSSSEGSTGSGFGAGGSAGQVTGTAEVLNMEGLSRLYDPLIIQLAMATSAQLEDLGVDESAIIAAAGGGTCGAIAAARALSNTCSFGKAGSGALMLQQHPMAHASSLGVSAAQPDPAPAAEGSGMLYSHLAAADEALSKLNIDLRRQRTDSISLGAGRSTALGELDDAALAALAPAGPEAQGEGLGG